MTTFYCASCNLAVSNALVALTNDENLMYEDGKDHIPAGHYVVSDGEHLTGSEGKVLLNRKDLKNVRQHSDRSRLSGCCGPDGMDGPNLICSNGHEIGTECSDCWMPHVVVLEADSTVSENQ
jgi:hypothetical protein